MFFSEAALAAFRDNLFCVDEQGQEYFYRDLIERARQFSARFTQGRGILVLEADNSFETIVAFVAALQSQCPIFLVNPTKGDALEGVGAEAYVYRYNAGQDHFEVRNLANGGPALHPDLALLLSTSGSTGAAKSVRLSSGNLHANAEAIAQYLELTAADRAPTNLPFYYSYGMSVVTSHLAVGGSLMLTERGMLEPAFWTAFDRHRCTSFAAVPHVIEMLEASGLATADHASLRYVTQAGGKLSPERVAQMARRAAAEGWKFFVMYGQTEAAPRMAYLPPDLAAEFPECMGRAIPGGSFELLDEDGRPITEPETSGELVYRGPNVMMGYALAVEDLAGPAEVDALHTGDIAVRNAQGLYRISGRKSRFIKPFGLRISLDEVDAWLATRGIAATSGAARNERLALLHEPGVDANAMRKRITEWLGVPNDALRLITVETLPRNANSKIDGRAVAQIIAEDEARDAPAMTNATVPVAIADGAMSPQEAEIARIWSEALGISSVARTDSFFDIGGDSLSAINVALRAEQRGMPKDMMRLMFEGRTVAEIAAITEGGDEVARSFERSRMAIMGDSINATRALLVLAVLVGHWAPFFLERIGHLGVLIGHYAEPAFHVGTPGFAMVFGLGVSFFTIPLLDRSPDRAMSNIRSNMITLAVGVLVFALLRGAVIQLVEGTFGPIWPEQLFYSVVLTYLMLVPSVPLLARVMRLTPNFIVNCLTLSAVSLAVLIGCQTLWAVQTDGWLNLVRLMLVTPYAYPQMLAAVGIGMAIGQWLRGQVDEPALAGKSLQLGLLLTIGGSLFLHYTGGFWAHPRQPHFFIFYAGLLLLAFSMMLKLVQLRAVPGLLRVMILIGLLSFPAYVGHLLVIPLKDIGVALGVPYVIALGVGFLLFFGGMGYAMLRLNRIYYPKGDATPARPAD